MVSGGKTMKERTPAWALKGDLECAFRPVAVPKGNSEGRLRPSRPMGNRAFAMKPILLRSECSSSIPRVLFVYGGETLVQHRRSTLAPTRYSSPIVLGPN